MMPGGHGNENPNANYMNGRGFWAFYVLVLTAAHLVLLCVPIDRFSVAWVWTCTNVGHNIVSFWFLHWIDHGIQYTPTRKFLTIIPILLFLLASAYTRHDGLHFVLNGVSLAFVLVPKLPSFHKVRLFGINKY